MNHESRAVMRFGTITLSLRYEESSIVCELAAGTPPNDVRETRTMNTSAATSTSAGSILREFLWALEDDVRALACVNESRAKRGLAPINKLPTLGAAT